MSQVGAFVIEKLWQLTVDSRDALFSWAWFYPLLGISYFASHPNLYEAVLPTLLKCLVASVGVTFGLIFFTYLPQVVFCASFSGIFAPIAAAVMVLGEAYVIIWIIGKPLMMNRVQDRLFDQVMVMQGHEKLVAKGREIHDQGQNMRLLGKEINIQPGLVDGLNREGALRYLVSLPLNSIPGIGTAMFLVYNGQKQGPGYHARYFQLKGWDNQVTEEFVHQRRAAYAAFGAAGLVLNMVPFIGLVFGMTTTVGAALWASKMEKTHESLEGTGRHVDRVGEDANNVKI
ncbi:hypothetical protein P691DRAFT_771934 [Macrolepiota fuliginosa MF-IS2]|uniref:Uncharacterized protein n=1 Tax=Macrolepiota fuliginosa MF-IS2 TaxID=1400762 RepID=A0A9P5XK17_9AGAR|nr:hypothetical protein P691DRAFT_771934 [Macrolepiota fuliginosa MF-IS2]